MMAAILNSAMLDWDTAILYSDTLLSSLRFTQKHYPSTLTLTQTNSIQLTRWWQPSWTLPSWIQPFCTKKTSLVHSDSTLWWQPSWILPSWIQPFCTKEIHLFIMTQLKDGSHLVFCHVGFLHFVQNKLHSFNLGQLDGGSHLEFYHGGFRHCHLVFRHLVIFSQIHSKTLSLHSDSDSN